MSEVKDIWLLFDSHSQQKSKPLSFQQAQMAILALPLIDKRFYIWTIGWAEWVELKKFLANKDCKFTSPPEEPSYKTKTENSKSKDITEINGLNDDTLNTINVPETSKVSNINDNKVDYGYYHKDVHGDDLSYSKIKKIKPFKTEDISSDEYSGSDRRQAERYWFQIEVILSSPIGKTFRAHTENISVNGTLLDKEIPHEFLSSQIEMVIINKFEKDPKKASLHFKGKVVGNLKDPKRLTFESKDPKNLEKLVALLEEYKTQKIISRK